MNFHRDRNLIILSVLFFAIIGSFLLGCSEGSESTPVGALMTDLSSEKYKSGGRTIDGTFNIESNVDNFNIQNPTPVKRSRQENISINDIQTRTPIQQNKFNSSSKEVSLSSINRQVAKTENKPKNERN